MDSWFDKRTISQRDTEYTAQQSIVAAMVRPPISRGNTLKDDVKASFKHGLKSYSLFAIYQCAVVYVLVNYPRKAMVGLRH